MIYAYTRLRYQVSVYRTIGPLVSSDYFKGRALFHKGNNLDNKENKSQLFFYEESIYTILQ